eukprot:SAG22_NODE_11832_length_467_cov_1.019022_1_plen_71_part_10
MPHLAAEAGAVEGVPLVDRVDAAADDGDDGQRQLLDVAADVELEELGREGESDTLEEIALLRARRLQQQDR